MASLIVLKSVAFLCAFAAIAKAADSSDSIQPPIGNKLVTTLIGRGMQVYKCEPDLLYSLDHAISDLYEWMDSTHNYYPRGKHYFLQHADGQGGKHTWSHFGKHNTATSTITGKVIARIEELDTIPDLLLQATSHSGPGAFERISYVSRSRSKDGHIPQTGCNNTGEIIHIYYEAFYNFYMREMSEPVGLPYTLLIPNIDVPIKSYFGQGVQIYYFDGSAWTHKNVLAELSLIPGQEVIGKHYFLSEPDLYGRQPTWETFMPYSRVTAKLQSLEVVDPNSIPWLSLQATSHMGSIYSLAFVSYVQRVSTIGGKPPENVDGVQIGDIYKSPYTAIYWFYAP